MAAIQGISDQPVESLTEDEDGGFDPATPDRDPAWRIEKKMFLQRLWEELTQLPVNQRAALLLNLKDASGFGCITLFPAIGIATIRQLAAALEFVRGTPRGALERAADRRRAHCGVARIDAPTSDKCPEIGPRTPRAAAERIYLRTMVIRSNFRQLLNMKPAGTPVAVQKKNLWNT